MFDLLLSILVGPKNTPFTKYIFSYFKPRRKKKCARLRPAGFRSVAAGGYPLSFDEINEETENEEDEDCCNTDEESTCIKGMAVAPATPILTTPEETYRRRFLLHHHLHHPSQMLLPPPATTPVGVARSYGLPRPPVTPAAAAVAAAAPADRKKNSMSILQQTSSPLVINSIPEERHSPNFPAK